MSTVLAINTLVETPTAAERQRCLYLKKSKISYFEKIPISLQEIFNIKE